MKGLLIATGITTSNIIILHLIASNTKSTAVWTFCVAFLLIGYIVEIVLLTFLVKSAIQKNYERNFEDTISTIEPQTQKFEYDNIPPKYVKKPLLTNNEKMYEQAIKNCTPYGFKLQSQICLASIIHKTYDNRYINELFRIIDFGILDANYNIKVLIEINDTSHYEYSRITRDNKIKEICKQANIPLITLWTKKGINEDYIRYRILNEIDQQYP